MSEMGGGRETARERERESLEMNEEGRRGRVGRAFLSIEISTKPAARIIDSSWSMKGAPETQAHWPSACETRVLLRSFGRNDPKIEADAAAGGR